MEPPEVQQDDYYQLIGHGWGNALRDGLAPDLFYDISQWGAGELPVYDRWDR